MSFGPTNYRQGGTRGGADQFKWEDVKNDKYRENYLGHSVQAPVGRWQKGKDLTWYNKLSKDDRAAALQDEIALAKQRDQELMDQALGIAPKRRAEPTGQLDAAEMKELLKRGASDREGLDGERVEGLGATPVAHDFEAKPKKTLAEKYEDDLAKGGIDQDIYALRGSSAAASVGADTGARSSRKEEKAMKKAMKKLKKKEKKLKKEKKKEKKRAKDEQGYHNGRKIVERHDTEARGRSLERRDRSSPRRRSVSSSASSSRSASPSRSRSRSPRAHRVDRRLRSRSLSRDRRPRHDARTSRARSRSRSRSRGRRQSRSRSVKKDRDYRSSRRSPPRRRGRSNSRDRSPSPRKMY